MRHPIRLALLAAGLAAVAAVPARPASSAAAAANVKAVTGAALKKAVDSYRGKPVFVNYWATWCEPCVAEFPDIVKLYNAYRAKGVVVISVSLDEPEDKGKVAAFVAKQKAGFPVFMRSGGAPEAFIQPVDKGWRGAVPSTYVFNRQGKRVSGPVHTKLSYEKMVEMLTPALK
jgi:thiol-disulfide isomerase/thioredoxin